MNAFNSENQEQTNKMNNLLALIANPLTSLGITINTTILWLMGILTPYLAFLAIGFGAAAGIYSFIHNHKQNKIDDLQIKVLENQLKDKKKK